MAATINTTELEQLQKQYDETKAAASKARDESTRLDNLANDIYKKINAITPTQTLVVTYLKGKEAVTTEMPCHLVSISVLRFNEKGSKQEVARFNNVVSYEFKEYAK